MFGLEDSISWRTVVAGAGPWQVTADGRLERGHRWSQRLYFKTNADKLGMPRIGNGTPA